jgi:hypothetical protein
MMKKAIFTLLIGICAAGAALYGQFPDFSDFSGSSIPGFSIPEDEASIRSQMAIMGLEGLIPMRFANALDGKPIPDAKVEIPGIGNFTTNAKGIISFSNKQANGAYSLVFSKSGFITTPIDFDIQVSTVAFNWYSISPGLQGDFRFVLDWGETPADLDIHLEKSSAYHISYANMHSAEDGSAKLDRDDRDGGGAETITLSRAGEANVYDLYVVDYTNRSKRSSTALSRSGACIRVYGNNRLLYTFKVPQGQGIRWNVFRIERNQIIPVNTLK